MYILKINYKGRRIVGKRKQRKNVENNNKFKNLKIKIKERVKKENPTELQKANIEAEVYNINKKCDWKKKLKGWNRLYHVNKIDNHNGGCEGRRKNPKEITKSKYKNNKCFSIL